MNCLRLLFAWVALLFMLPGHADYDPDAEVQRLIARATEERATAIRDLESLKAASERSKQDFLLLNDTAYQLGQTLRKVRVMDARNKAILLVKTGLNITAVNAPGKLLEVGVDIAVSTGSETLKNQFPTLFDTSVTLELPRLGAESVAAVARFNEVLAYSDDQVSERLKKEVPELARDRGALYEFVAGGKLNDDLIALKRAEYIINEGRNAENALNALKAALANKRQELINAIKAIEDKIRYLTEDIRSWEHGRSVARDIREMSKLKEPEKVAPAANPRYDFGSAAQMMRGALESLKANQVDCGGYYTLFQNAYQGAWAVYTELHRAAWDANALDQFNATVRKDFNNQVGGAQAWVGEQLSLAASGPAASFMSRYRQWQDTSLLVPGDSWDTRGQAFRIGQTEGGGVAGAIFGQALSLSPEPLKDWFQIEVGGLSLDALRYPEYSLRRAVEYQLEHSQHTLRTFDAMLANARKTASAGQHAAGEAVALAQALEPHRHFWGCALSMDMSGIYLHLKRFSPTYTPAAAAAERNAQQVREVLQRGANTNQALHGALGGERSALEAWGAGEELRGRVNDAAAKAGAFMWHPLNPYPLWSRLKELGITESSIKEIQDSLPALANPQEAIKDYNGRAGNPSGTGSLPILKPDAIAKLTQDLKRQGAAAIANQSEYRDLYNQLVRRQDSLKSQINGLRTAVEAATGKPSGISVPVLLDESLYMVPNDIPDPTAGVFELVERYGKVAAEYHARLEALQPWTFAFYPKMEALLKRIEQDGSSKAAGDEEAFRKWWNEASQEWSRMQREAAIGSTQPLSHTTPFGKLASQVMARLMDLAGQVSQRERVARITENLNGLLRGASGFLANPDVMGGHAMARDWLRYLDDAVKPGSDAHELRGNGTVAGLMGQLGSLRPRLESYLSKGSDEQVRKFYDGFANAYQSRNLPLLLRFLAPDWQAGDGSDLRDLETTLGNSFRLFERIQVSISGLSVRVAGSGFEASYTIKLSGRIARLQKTHEESAQVVDTLVMTEDGLKIHRTSGGLGLSGR